MGSESGTRPAAVADVPGPGGSLEGSIELAPELPAGEEPGGVEHLRPVPLRPVGDAQLHPRQPALPRDSTKSLLPLSPKRKRGRQPMAEEGGRSKVT